MADLLTLRTYTLDVLNDTNISPVYPQSVVDRIINEVHLELYTKKKWQFARGQAMYKGRSQTTLDTDLLTTDTVINVGQTSDYDTVGAIIINRDVIEYTGKTALTFTGASGILIDHNEGEIVKSLLTLPSDFLRMPVLFLLPNAGTKLIPVPFVNEFEFEHDRQTRRFTLVNDDTGKTWIWVEGMSSEQRLVLYYQKKPTVLVNDIDISSVPDEWASKIIPKYAAYKLMFLYGDNLNNEGNEIKAIADDEIMNMFKLYGERDEGWSKLIKSEYKSQISDTAVFQKTRI